MTEGEVIRFSELRTPDQAAHDLARLGDLSRETDALMEKYARVIIRLAETDKVRFQREEENFATMERNLKTVREYIDAPHQTSPEGTLSLISTLTNNLMFLRSQMPDRSDDAQGSGVSSDAGK